MYSRLDRIPACDYIRRTDILPQHSLHYAYTLRSKNQRKKWSREQMQRTIYKPLNLRKI